jgi:hypothetical protein
LLGLNNWHSMADRIDWVFCPIFHCRNDHFKNNYNFFGSNVGGYLNGLYSSVCFSFKGVSNQIVRYPNLQDVGIIVSINTRYMKSPLVKNVLKLSLIHPNRGVHSIVGPFQGCAFSGICLYRIIPILNVSLHYEDLGELYFFTNNAFTLRYLNYTMDIILGGLASH